MEKFSIKIKLLIGFIGISTLFALTSLIVIFEIVKIKEKSDELAYFKKYTDISYQIQLEISNIWQYFTDASLTLDEEVVKVEALNSYNKSKDLISALSLMKNNNITLKAESELILTKLNNLFKVGEKMFSAYKIDKLKGDIVMEEYDKVCSEGIDYVTAFVEKMNKKTNDISLEINTTTQNTINYSVAALSSIFLISILFGIYVSNKISKNLKLATHLIEKLSLGDFKGFDSLIKQ